MKTSKILALAALSFAAVAGVAQAEPYPGVTTVNSVLTRAEVRAQAVAAAHAADPWAEGASAVLSATPVAQADRTAVRAGAQASTQNVNAEPQNGGAAL